MLLLIAPASMQLYIKMFYAVSAEFNPLNLLSIVAYWHNDTNIINLS
ncbi:hypothetical protein PPAR_a0402 [Pseudoalteromonas paragorgicola KMM 3548]|nr:hypothetical protein [Pseudoalteromonas distincta KMM 3548]